MARHRGGENNSGKGDCESVVGREWGRFKRNLTIEPMIFFYQFGTSMVMGSAVNTDMLIYKVCRYEYGYNETVCDNLETNEAYEDAESRVQRRVNDIQLIQGWLDSGPSLFYVFFAGAISDHLGRKPLIYVPLIGLLIANVSDIINWAFLDVLPVEFFYLENTMSLFGGYSVYYLGVYGFGSSFTENPDDRAHVLARYDGIESFARIVGTALSPIVFDAAGYYASFAIRASSTACAILYMFFVKEPHVPEKKMEKKALEAEGLQRKKPNVAVRACQGIYKYVFVGTYDTVKTILKPRPHGMRPLILMQLLQYALSIFTFTYVYLLYLYLLYVFDSDGDDYSHLTLVTDILSTIGLLVIVPVLTGRLRVSEPAVMTLITTTVSLGLFSMAFAKTKAGFYFANWATFLQMSQFGPGRALITKSVEENEMGKILSGNAIISAGIPLGSSPLFRQLYDRTLETYPSAFILLSAGSAVLQCFLNFFLFTQRGRFKDKMRSDEDDVVSEAGSDCLEEKKGAEHVVG